MKTADSQGFFYLILGMGRVTSSSEKWVTLPLMPTKKWVACSDNKTVFNNHETHTLHICNNEQMRSLVYKNAVHLDTNELSLSHSLTQGFF